MRCFFYATVDILCNGKALQYGGILRLVCRHCRKLPSGVYLIGLNNNGPCWQRLFLQIRIDTWR